MKIVNYKVEGMSCDHCVKSVKKAAQKVAGVIEADVSLENNDISLKIDENLFNLEELIKNVSEAGYYKVVV
ncbi:MAG: heavy-metal-associated domain-containing protein [Calditrichia bacterium]